MRSSPKEVFHHFTKSKHYNKSHFKNNLCSNGRDIQQKILRIHHSFFFAIIIAIADITSSREYGFKMMPSKPYSPGRANTGSP